MKHYDALRDERDLAVRELAAAQQHVAELQEQLRIAARVAADTERQLCELRARMS